MSKLLALVALLALCTGYASASHDDNLKVGLDQWSDISWDNVLRAAWHDPFFCFVIIGYAGLMVILMLKVKNHKKGNEPCKPHLRIVK